MKKQQNQALDNLWSLHNQTEDTMSSERIIYYFGPLGGGHCLPRRRALTFSTKKDTAIQARIWCSDLYECFPVLPCVSAWSPVSFLTFAVLSYSGLCDLGRTLWKEDPVGMSHSIADWCDIQGLDGIQIADEAKWRVVICRPAEVLQFVRKLVD